ncbi:MAG: rhamnulokinase [Lachnospiraceae bacterium]
MSAYYLAVDIGASSGRHILGSVENGKIILEEVYRFENGMKKQDGMLCWDHHQLFEDIKIGIKKCKEIGKIPVSMGIDTWGVDFVLLDEKDQVLGNMVGYRDKRTEGMEKEVFSLIPEEQLYERTGIQKQAFNTIYQLMAVKKQHPEQMEQAKTLLFVPDYFHFLLTGVKRNEYTEATTSQLVDPITKDWNYDLIKQLGFHTEIFQPMITPGTSLGELKPEIREELGVNMEVVLPCTHDTGSAVLAVPANDDDFVYISSGTWSLMGIEREKADCTEIGRNNNFTNEGGYDYQFRYIKNIMGLWMIQSIRHNLDDRYHFAQICEEAEKAKDFPSRVDVNADCFLAPDNMVEEVKEYCKNTQQAVPNTLGELATVVYASLAEEYHRAIQGIERSMGRTYSRIHIVGGGANAGYLNQLTAQATQKEVHAGPTEATAIGNLVAQMLKYKEFPSKEEARGAIHRSFDIQVYKPN